MCVCVCVPLSWLQMEVRFPTLDIPCPASSVAASLPKPSKVTTFDQVRRRPIQPHPACPLGQPTGVDMRRTDQIIIMVN